MSLVKDRTHTLITGGGGGWMMMMGVVGGVGGGRIGRGTGLPGNSVAPLFAPPVVVAIEFTKLLEIMEMT